MDQETIVAYLEGIRSDIAAVKHTIEEVRIQATATNGRVTKLETWKTYTEGLKAGAGGLWQFALGALGAGGILLGIITALKQ